MLCSLMIDVFSADKVVKQTFFCNAFAVTIVFYLFNMVFVLLTISEVFTALDIFIGVGMFLLLAVMVLLLDSLVLLHSSSLQSFLLFDDPSSSKQVQIFLQVGHLFETLIFLWQKLAILLNFFYFFEE